MAKVVGRKDPRLRLSLREVWILESAVRLYKDDARLRVQLFGMNVSRDDGGQSKLHQIHLDRAKKDVAYSDLLTATLDQLERRIVKSTE